MKRFRSTLALVAGLGGAASASTIELTPCANFIAGLGERRQFAVVCQDVRSPGAELRVLLGPEDVTADVVVSSVVDAADDADRDGTFERHARTFTLDFASVAFAESTLVFEARAEGADGPLLSRRSATLLRPLSVSIGDDAWVPELDGSIVRFYLRVEHAPAGSMHYTVWLDDEDVTSRVGLRATVLRHSTRGDDLTLDWLAAVVVDLAALPVSVGQALRLDVRYEYPWAGEPVSHSVRSPPVVRRESKDEEAIEAAIRETLQPLAAATWLSTASGSTTYDMVEARKVDAVALAERWKALGLRQAKTVRMDAGWTATVGLSHAASEADLVLVLGDPTGVDRRARDAIAWAAKPGGAAWAIGAGASNGGAGGIAVALSSGAAALALGGRGGEHGETAGAGGSAWADSGSTPSQVVAVGGDGGRALEPSALGGSGGAAHAQMWLASFHEHSGGRGELGQSGTGATAIRDGDRSLGEDGTP